MRGEHGNVACARSGRAQPTQDNAFVGAKNIFRKLRNLHLTGALANALVPADPPMDPTIQRSESRRHTPAVAAIADRGPLLIKPPGINDAGDNFLALTDLRKTGAVPGRRRCRSCMPFSAAPHTPQITGHSSQITVHL